MRTERTALRVIDALTEAPACVAELAEKLSVTRHNVYLAIAELKDLKMVRTGLVVKRSSRMGRPTHAWELVA
jgi:predicted ArsR family transcriptional regulator